MRALISVSDKTDLLNFAKGLSEIGYELISTGGTSSYLREHDLPVTDVADVTGHPEILEGRVKTLHPNIHGAILRDPHDDSHRVQMEGLGIIGIDVVVNNLYPFGDVISDKNSSMELALENIDIGGPAMTRAAAKNFLNVLVVVDPKDYEWVGQLLLSGNVSVSDRRRLAAKAFQHVAFYDSLIADYLFEDSKSEQYRNKLTNAWERVSLPRYGENPHQSAAIYKRANEKGGIVNATKLHGIDMSYLNYYDADAAWSAVTSFHQPCVAIVKHSNPCGLAISQDQTEAYKRALSGDPVSAFGGIVGFNTKVSENTAKAMEGIFLDVIVAPSYETRALDILTKRKKTRILQVHPDTGSPIMIRSVSGGVLLQESDLNDDKPDTWSTVSKATPSKKTNEDLRFAWTVSGLVKSNAIVIAKDKAIRGIGAGQPNRLNSVKLAVEAAGEDVKNSVLASDAFFPFPDGIEEAAKAGVKAVIQPGGSIRDTECINTVNDLGIIMVFTGTRHFLH